MNPELLARFLPRFVETAKVRLDKCVQLLASKDAPQTPAGLKAEFHSLAGEASMLGLAELGQVAREAEQAAKRWEQQGDAAAMVICARAVRTLSRGVGDLEAPAPVEEPGAVTATMRAPARVLVVDDSPINAAALGDGLEQAGLQVRTAETAGDAVAAVSEFGPKLVLTDVQMPGVDLAEMCQRLRAAARGSLQIVLLSGLGDSELSEAAERAGADGWIPKSAGLAGIVEQVGTLVGGDG